MKCPVCGKKLYRIQVGEWYCDNTKCASNKRMGVGGYAEFYGKTQAEVNDSSIHKEHTSKTEGQ